MSSTSHNPVQVTIEQGGSEDLDGVMDVMSHAFEASFGEGWSRSQCAGILPLSGVMLTVARDQSGKIRGFSLQRTIAGESELLLLAVNRAAQRCGIGSKLLDRFVESSRLSGAKRLHLEVRDGNPATVMYRAYGFSAEGRRSNYYRGSDGQLFDAVTMALNAS
ncbi:MAG: GNAT family N-acetyltransferase [Sphingomicrobium sp.]